MSTSIATRARVATKHLSRELYDTIIRPDGVYLCEPVTQLIEQGMITHVIRTKKLICSFAEDDNVWGLRHTRAVRDITRLKEQWDERMELPRAKRAMEAAESSGIFKDEFKAKSTLEGWFGHKTI